MLMACWQFGHHANAQHSPSFENLSIDRPDVSNLPTTVRPGHYQFEIGSEWGNGVQTNEFYVPNMVFRTGINTKSELRIGINRLYLDSIGSGMSDDVIFASISGKYRFVEEDGLRPAIAIQPEFSLPFGDGAYIHHGHPNYSLADYSIILLFNNTLREQIFLNYNAGMFWSRSDRIDWLLSASASFLHTHRFGYFLELFTLVENDQFPLSVDGGLMFLVTPRLQFDAYFGYRALEEEAAWYGGVGVGFRLDRGDMVRKTFREIGIHH
jgi:hypothetical protein